MLSTNYPFYTCLSIYVYILYVTNLSCESLKKKRCIHTHTEASGRTNFGHNEPNRMRPLRHSRTQSESVRQVQGGVVLWPRLPGIAMATISRLLQMIRHFCKRALQKRLYSAKETYNFKELTTRSPPILPGIAMFVGVSVVYVGHS